jgi:hypothetical protein
VTPLDRSLGHRAKQQARSRARQKLSGSQGRVHRRRATRSHTDECWLRCGKDGSESYLIQTHTVPKKHKRKTRSSKGVKGGHTLPGLIQKKLRQFHWILRSCVGETPTAHRHSRRLLIMPSVSQVSLCMYFLHAFACYLFLSLYFVSPFPQRPRRLSLAVEPPGYHVVHRNTLSEQKRDRMKWILV